MILLSQRILEPLSPTPVFPEWGWKEILTRNGSFQGNNGDSEAIYQVPLIRYDRSDVAELVVVISGVENIDYYNGETHITVYSLYVTSFSPPTRRMKLDSCKEFIRLPAEEAANLIFKDMVYHSESPMYKK